MGPKLLWDQVPSSKTSKKYPYLLVYEGEGIWSKGWDNWIVNPLEFWAGKQELCFGFFLDFMIWTYFEKRQRQI